MTQDFGSPMIDSTKEAREALRLALGLAKDIPFDDYINHIPSQWTPAELFSNGEIGFWYEPDDINTLFQNYAEVTPVSSHNDPVGLVKDKSGNEMDAFQTTSAKRLTYKKSPARLFMDKVDDVFYIKIPSGGLLGTMVVSTDAGTASYEVFLQGGYHPLGDKYFVGSSIIGVLFRAGSIADNDKSKIEEYFVRKGGVDSFVNVADFRNGWYGYSFLTEFPLIDTSSATSINSTWSKCSSLTSFPLIDTSRISTFYYSWHGCSSLTDFPLIDTSNATKFIFTWSDCSSLMNFPADFFDNIKGGDFQNAFVNTNLSQESIDSILASLVTSGIESGTRRFTQTGGSAPSETGEAAIDTLRSRGWTVNVTGGY